MRVTNKLNLPDAFLQAVLNDTYSPGSSDITTTQLISSPRMVQLKKRHDDKIVVDVADRIWLLFGSANHEILDRSETRALTEQRVYINVAGWKIGCQFDRLLLAQGLLQDYKVTSVWSVMNGHKPEWEQQLNVMAHALRLNWYDIAKLQIVAILRDYRRGEALQNKDYPPHQVHVIDIPLWTPEQAQAYIEERIRLHQEAAKLADDKLPDCSPEERWLRGEKWAVKKEGAKRATRTFPTEAEAASDCADRGAGYVVEYRQGESLRCAEFCECSGFCSQWKKIQEENK